MTVAQLICKLKKMPQDAIVTMENNNCYINGEYIVTYVEDNCGTVEICTDYTKNLTCYEDTIDIINAIDIIKQNVNERGECIDKLARSK